MYEILIGLFIFVLINFVILMFLDKELRYLHELGIKKVKFIELRKLNFLFLNNMKVDKTISRFTFNITLLFYSLNLIGLIILTLHFITNIELLFIVSCIVLFFNIPILLISMIKISLNKEQQRIKRSDQNRKRNTKNK